jgi:hypothetical protein
LPQSSPPAEFDCTVFDWSAVRWLRHREEPTVVTAGVLMLGTERSSGFFEFKSLRLRFLRRVRLINQAHLARVGLGQVRLFRHPCLTPAELALRPVKQSGHCKRELNPASSARVKTMARCRSIGRDYGKTVSPASLKCLSNAKASETESCLISAKLVQSLKLQAFDFYFENISRPFLNKLSPTQAILTLLLERTFPMNDVATSRFLLYLSGVIASSRT